MKERPFSHFLARLIWLCMVPPLLLAAWFAHGDLQEIEAKHLREGENLAVNHAGAVELFLQARTQALNMLAISPLADDPRRWRELYAEAQGFKDSFGTHVIFADTERQMLFNTRAPFGSSLPKLPLSKGRSAAPLALETGRPQVGDIVTGPIANTLLVAIVVPGLRAGKVAHLMLTTVDATRLQQDLGPVALPPGWSIALQDGTGADIARRSPPRFDSTRDVDADHRFVARLALAPWSVVVEIPRASHHEQQVRAVLVLAAMLALAILLGVLGGVLAGRRIGRQVALLAAPPGDDAAGLEIAEVAEARRRIVESAARLEESQINLQLWTQAFRQADVGLAIADARSNTFVAVNPAFARQRGYAEEELLGQPVTMVFSPAGVADLRAALNAPDASSHFVFESEHQRKDGSRFPVHADVTVVRDAHGTPQNRVVYVLDISDRKRAEQALAANQAAELERQRQARVALLNQMQDANAERVNAEMAAAALRESQERLQLLIDHAPAALAMFDRDMRYLAVSQRWRDDYGLGDRELSGHSHYEIFPEIPEAWKAVHRRGLAGEVLSAAEDRFARLDGTVRWLHWEVRPWHKVGDGIGGIVIFSEDITAVVEARHEVLRLNTELEQRVVERTAELTAANQELDAFAYAVSHDLRAPLRAMSGFSRALLEDYGAQLAGEARSFLDQIDLASRRMGELIDGILALSRSTRGELRREPVDLSALARERLGELARHHPERRVDWEVEPGLAVRGDPAMLGAVLDNLLDNAWKYTRDRASARIRVQAGEVGGQPGICVTDNGAGFDPAHAARLFQPFQRLHRQDEFPGIGIGLSTVQRIIHRHGGTIIAAGEPGRGARFCFILPGNTEENPA